MPPGVTWFESNSCHPVLAVKSRYAPANRSRIREHTVSLRFLGIILRVLRLEFSVYIVYIKKTSTHFCSRGRGSKLSQLRPRIRPLDIYCMYVHIVLNHFQSSKNMKD